ncbi:hypothetical protein PIB30_017391 [Stylosanthes scabra]|uniref:Uncharacterized protein n=1 Tax=Stylosanthes scabra TaxID=79078 RepID=A0ABU6V6N4_9FABA|nr:hypothetical protein [Stylosanthes scabra]
MEMNSLHMFVWPNHVKQVCFSSIEDLALATLCETVEKANPMSHSFTQGLAHTVGKNSGFTLVNLQSYDKNSKELEITSESKASIFAMTSPRTNMIMEELINGIVKFDVN